MTLENQNIWYMVQGDKFGPITRDELWRLYDKGILFKDTMVWYEGLGFWETLIGSEIFPESDFNSVEAVAPPNPPASPLRRFAARYFDLLVESYIAVLLLALVLPEHIIFSPWFYLIAPAVTVIVVDTAIHSVFGNTAGNAFLGVKVVGKDRNIHSGDIFARNVRVWFFGMAMGIPIIFLITSLYQRHKLIKTGATGYDAGESYTVQAESISLTRKLLFTAASLFIIFTYAIFT